MPWKETKPMEERARLVQQYQTGRYTISELAQAFAVSRKTVYQVLQRVAREGAAGYLPRSRAPQRHPNATPPEVVAAVLSAKHAHPTWGPLKLQPPEAAPPAIVTAWPKPSTRRVILERAGLVRRRRYRARAVGTGQPLTLPTAPNVVWSADFKGWFRTADGTRCDPATISDAYSRMLLACTIIPPKTQPLRQVFEWAFREYGLPLVLRTDNGAPFASTGAGGLSQLAVWWIRLGITLERIAPAHPEQNGRHERLHRTLKADCCRPPAATPAAQQARFTAWQAEYNARRPHQALGQVPPATHYHPSERPYPDRLPELVYPAGVLVRHVRNRGEIKWQGRSIFVSEALRGEAVGIRDAEAGWEVSFGPVYLGLLDTRGERLIKGAVQPPRP